MNRFGNRFTSRRTNESWSAGGWSSSWLQNRDVALQFNSMRFTAILPLVFVITSLGGAKAHGQTAESQFQAGVAAYRKGDTNAARAAFHSSLKLDASNPVTLYNLGLAEHQAGRPGLALGIWRKALAGYPYYRPAREAITWAQPKLERPEIPHEVETWESFRSALLVPVSVETYLTMTALLLLLSGLLLLRYVGNRRRSLLDEKPLPPFPTVAAIFAVGFFVTGVLSVCKTIDANEVRGTVLVKKVEARSAPDASGTALFDLFEGLEVIVRQSRGTWVQVSYPGASTGWIPRSAILATTDKVVP